jgi:hypothetical protein
MNRSLTNVLFGGMGTQSSQETHKIEGSITKTAIDETVEILANADSVILVSPHGEHGARQSLMLSEGGWVWHGSCESSIVVSSSLSSPHCVLILCPQARSPRYVQYSDLKVSMSALLFIL